MPKMRTSFQGLVKLLAKSLYPEPDVFIRELIQNAHDSIQLRRVQEPRLAGEIRIMTDNHARTISFIDNGAGMGRYEIEEFLSTIGSTGTGTRARELASRHVAVETIGQFGIGLLSAFVVAERIDVYTRKFSSREAWHWHNLGGEDYELVEWSPAEQPPGSCVTVTLTAEQAGYLDENIIRGTVKRYADFLPFPIFLNDIGPLNTIDAPWHRPERWPDAHAYGKALDAFLQQRYRDKPLHVIPIDLPTPAAQGVLYIARQNIPGVHNNGVLDIFQERMCVRLNDTELLPDWARFVRGVLDSSALQPTAARDNVLKDKAYYQLRRALGELILQSLVTLAERQRPKFLQLCDWHHHDLKGMAVHSEEFYRAVIEHLPFETNCGGLTLRDYTASQPATTGAKKPVYFFTHDQDAQQFYALCGARGLIVINAGRQFDEALVRRYVGQHPHGLTLKQLDVLDDPALYERLDEPAEHGYEPLLTALRQALEAVGMDRVRPGVRRFLPAEMNAVLLSTRRTQAFDDIERMLARPMLLEGLEELAADVRDKLRQQPLDLFLNADNPFIQRLRELPKLDDPAYRPLLVGIYSSAILNAQYRLTPENVQIFQTQLQALLDETLTLRSRLQALTAENERLRQTLEHRPA